MKIDKFKIFCETEAAWKYVLVPDGGTVPSECPADANHAITAGSVAIDCSYDSLVNLSAAELSEISADDPSSYVSGKIEAAMEFGKRMIVSYGTQNVLAGKTVAQIRAISVKLAEVQTLLLSGSLYCARQAIIDMEVDENVTQGVKDEFLAKLNAYLGL